MQCNQKGKKAKPALFVQRAGAIFWLEFNRYNSCLVLVLNHNFIIFILHSITEKKGFLFSKLFICMYNNLNWHTLGLQ